MPDRLPRRSYVTGILFLLVGLALACGGGWLVALGGSAYYLIAGIGVAATGLLVLLRRVEALWLYGLVLAGTVIWAISEVGLNGWGLEPRLVAPTILSLWLLLPWVRSGLVPADPQAPRARYAVAAPGVTALVAIVVLVIGFLQPVGIDGASAAATFTNQVDTSVPASDWWFYGRTPKGDRFSPLDQVNTGNVNKLQVAWTTETGDRMRPGEDIGGTDAGHEFNFVADLDEAVDFLPTKWKVDQLDALQDGGLIQRVTPSLER